MLFYEKAQLIEGRYGSIVEKVEFTTCFSMRVTLKNNIEKNLEDEICKLVSPTIVEFKIKKVLT